MPFVLEMSSLLIMVVKKIGQIKKSPQKIVDPYKLELSLDNEDGNSLNPLKVISGMQND